MPSNKKNLTLPPLPSKESVKQELRIIAGALFKGSRLSGSESFMIKTPALAALHDEERFTHVGYCFISSCGKIAQCSSDRSSRKYESLD